MRRRARPSRALAISAICWCARERSSTRFEGSRSKPSSSMSACARFRISPVRRTPLLESSRPRNRFSSTVRLGTSENSWNTGLMPIARACCGVRWRISSPPNRNVPSSGGKVPEMTLIRVDLPAPFSPKRTCNSPARTSKSTRSRAWTPVNRFEMPLNSSRGSVRFRSVLVSISFSVSDRQPGGRNRVSRLTPARLFGAYLALTE
jgi:hypothetical protein